MMLLALITVVTLLAGISLIRAWREVGHALNRVR